MHEIWRRTATKKEESFGATLLAGVAEPANNVLLHSLTTEPIFDAVRTRLVHRLPLAVTGCSDVRLSDSLVHIVLLESPY